MPRYDYSLYQPKYTSHNKRLLHQNLKVLARWRERWQEWGDTNDQWIEPSCDLTDAISHCLFILTKALALCWETSYLHLSPKHISYTCQRSAPLAATQFIRHAIKIKRNSKIPKNYRWIGHMVFAHSIHSLNFVRKWCTGHLKNAWMKTLAAGEFGAMRRLPFLTNTTSKSEMTRIQNAEHWICQFAYTLYCLHRTTFFHFRSYFYIIKCVLQ